MQVLKAQYSAANYDMGDYANYGASPKTNEYFRSLVNQPSARVPTYHNNPNDLASPRSFLSIAENLEKGKYDGRKESKFN